MFRHFALTVTMILTSMGHPSMAQTNPEPIVVFVCEHGNAKSTIAAAHFNRMAESNGLPYRAISRGIQPDPDIPKNIITGLWADGLDVSAWKPKLVSDAEIRQAERVVTLACEMPKSKPVPPGKLIDWNNLPAVSDGYDNARSEIVRRVEQLLKTLSSTQPQQRRWLPMH